MLSALNLTRSVGKNTSSTSTIRNAKEGNRFANQRSYAAPSKADKAAKGAPAKKKKVREAPKKFDPYTCLKGFQFSPTKREDVPQWFATMAQEYMDGNFISRNPVPYDGGLFHRKERKDAIKAKNKSLAKSNQ